MLKLFRKNKAFRDVTHYTASVPADTLFAPKNIYLLLAEPVLAVGDDVSIGDPVGFLVDKKTVYAGISGKVAEISERDGHLFEVVIENDFLKRTSDKCIPFGKRNSIKVTDLTPEILIKEIEDAGINSRLGSISSFPRSLSERISAADKKAKQIVINCAPSDPCDSAAQKSAIEHPEDVINGMKILMSALKIGEGVLVLDSECLEEARVLSEFINSGDNIKVVVTELPYPCDSEHLMIHALTSIELSIAKNAERLACAVFDIKEALCIGRAFLYGEKETGDIVTLSGDISDAVNTNIPYGTKFSEIISYYASGFDTDMRIIVGGLLRGREVSENDAFESGMSPISIINAENIPAFDGNRCVKCGECARVCPMMLMPSYLWRAKTQKAADHFDVCACIECGACQYVCPAEIPILENIRRFKKREDTDK